MQPRLALLLIGRSEGPCGRSHCVIRPDLSNQCLAEAALGNHWLDFATGAGKAFSRLCRVQVGVLQSLRVEVSRWISVRRGRVESVVAIVYKLRCWFA